MQTTTWKRELAIASGLLAFGLLGLPAAIYFVGHNLIGEYAPGGMMALAESIWRDFLSLRLAAWTLVLSPYLIVQVARAARRVWLPKSV